MKAIEQARTASWINVLAGFWLIFVPFIFRYTDPTEIANDAWFGTVVIMLALIRAFTPTNSPGLSWFIAVTGLWLIVSPFGLRFSDATAIWNDVIIGILIGGVALWDVSAGTKAKSKSEAHT